LIIVEDSSEMGGVQYSSFLLAKELQYQKEIKPLILLPCKGPFTILCEKNAIPFQTYPSKVFLSTSIKYFTDQFRLPNPIAWIHNIFSIIYNSIQIKSILKLHQNSVILSKGLQSHLTTSLACWNTPHHLIWHLQDLISDRYRGSLYRIFNWVAYKNIDHIICDGETIQKRLGPISRLKSTVILNGIDTAELKRKEKYRIRIRQEFKLQTNAYVIGHVGRITPWKGQAQLLNAFIKYSKINLDAYLLLVGSPLFDDDKYYQKIKEIISQYGLDERIIMPGYRSDLNAIFSAMDLFIYPSLEKDTSPLALLSAISSGLPVAISSIESLEELVKNNNEIDRFDPRDSISLLSIFKKYEDKELRLKKGLKNRSYGKKYFDISCHTKKMNEVFNSV